MLRIDWKHIDAMTSEHLDALFSFFTTAPAHELSAEHEQKCIGLAPWERKFTSISLDFSKRTLTPECLKRTQELLDRVFSSPTRRYSIESLDLSSQELEPEHLQYVTEILKKGCDVYGSEYIQLSETVMQQLGEDTSARVSGALQQVISAVIGFYTFFDNAAPSETSQASQLEPVPLQSRSGDALADQHLRECQRRRPKAVLAVDRVRTLLATGEAFFRRRGRCL